MIGLQVMIGRGTLGYRRRLAEANRRTTDRDKWRLVDEINTRRLAMRAAFRALRDGRIDAAIDELLIKESDIWL